MKSIRTIGRYIRKNEVGATAIEYGLLAGLIAVVIIAALLLLGPELKKQFDNVYNAIK